MATTNPTPTGHDGLMVALMLAPDAAKALAQPDGEPDERLHCTLAYLGKLSELPKDAPERAAKAVAAVAAVAPPLSCVVSGCGTFEPTESETQRVLVALLDCPELAGVHLALREALEAVGLSPRREHGFVPHVTLRYADPGAELSVPAVAGCCLEFGALHTMSGSRVLGQAQLRGRVEKAQHSREYLEEALKRAKELLLEHGAGWAWASIHRAAMPAAGGRARSERDDTPSVLEKVALVDIRPRALRKLPDDEIREAWLRLHQWLASAQRRKRPVEDIVNAAVWVADEMERRGFDVDKESELWRQIQALTGGRSRMASVYGTKGPLPKKLEAMLAQQPDEIVLVRDWLAVAGSAAVTEKPGDIDVVVRSELDEERNRLMLDGTGVLVALRRFLAPDKKKGGLQLLASPAGSFTDYVPIYDLVARRREPSVQLVEPEPAAYEGQERVIKQAPEEPPLGLHAHALRRRDKVALVGGSHHHVFVLENGTQLLTEHDGEHGHPLPAEDSAAIPNEPASGGEHLHRVALPGDMRERFGVAYLVTELGGQHGHQLQARMTAGDGVHVHELKLPGGLVARSLAPGVEPGEDDGGPEEVEQQEARAASAKLKAQAAKARREDKLTLGEFFFMPKPTRPAQPEQLMTVDNTVKLFEERADKWLPALLQKKYDGARHQIHRDGDKVLILSEDGDDNTARLPGVVKAVMALKPKQLVLDCEIERWAGSQHLPREAMSGYLSETSESDDIGIVANCFDVLYHEDIGDVHLLPLTKRLELLAGLKIRQSTMGVPDATQKLNHAPSVEVTTPDELRKKLEQIRKLPGSEGIVSKQAGSTFPLDVVTPDSWVKFHNATTLRAIVIERKPTRGGAAVYSYGVLPGDMTAEDLRPVKGRQVVPVGDSFSTARSFAPGDAILIEAETVNLSETLGGVALTAWVPRVIGSYEGQPDSIRTAATRAKENLVLQRKRVTEGGAVEYLPPEVRKAAPQVPTSGKPGADVMFVGASPNREEGARREASVGPSGQTFRESYLPVLGLGIDDVAITNAVPMVLRDGDKVREPNVEELKEWRDWLRGEVERIRPHVLVALGRTAEGAIDAALGRKADVTLPHPMAVRRFSDRGEVARKLRNQVKPLLEERKRKGERVGTAGEKVEKQPPRPLLEEGGEETRGERAFESWESDWYKRLSRSAKGRFVYQHHWRGLSEEEVGLSDKALMDTSHSVHGDIRLEGEGGELWGWAVLLGRAEDNRSLPHQDKLIDIETVRRKSPGDKIELAPKLPQPNEWLEVGKRSPLVTGPGEIGATSQKYSKFFARDWGTYKLGVARQHAVEIWLDGKILRGRYLLQFAPVAGRRRWLIDKPEDEKPMAESRDLADLLGELRQKRQPYVFWGLPGESKLLDVRTGEPVRKSAPVQVPILKQRTDQDKRIVYGVVLDPYVVDAHNDWIPPSEVEATAHGWFESSREINLNHSQGADAQAVESSLVEYPSRDDYRAAMAGEPHRAYRRKFGDDVVHSGTWIIGVRLSPELWAAYQKGDIAAFSIEGFGMRNQAKRRELPKVSFVDQIEVDRKGR